jgi:hypothetical protein
MHAPARADHHADTAFSTALRSARQEGTYDVVLARTHPLAAGRLPLATLIHEPVPRRRLAGMLAAPIDVGTWAAIERALQWAGAHQTWRRVTGLAMSMAYAAGVRDALADPGELDELLAPIRSNRDVLEVSVDPRHGPMRVPAGHHGRVVLTFPTLCPTASLHAAMPGATWDAEQVLADAARLLASEDRPVGTPRTLLLERDSGR